MKIIGRYKDNHKGYYAIVEDKENDKVYLTLVSRKSTKKGKTYLVEVEGKRNIDVFIRNNKLVPLKKMC